MSVNPKEAKDLLSNCKNKEGKSLFDIYTLVSEIMFGQPSFIKNQNE